MRVLLCWILYSSLVYSEPLKLLVIGDSQSEEYAFEFPFSAPDSNPLIANTKNWVEILNAQRAEEVTFGGYESLLFSYAPTVRNAGFEYNWGVPAFETDTWVELISSNLFENQGLLPSRVTLAEQLPEIDAIVIILGGNDANGDYRALQNNAPPANWQGNIVDNLETLIDFVRVYSSKPLLLANIPDVGATTEVQREFPDPAKRLIATDFIKLANTAISELAEEKNAILLDFFSITETLAQSDAIRIGSIEFIPRENPENAPRYLLCKDGFHPSTAAQCLLANLVLEGLQLSPLSDDEILQQVLGLPLDLDDSYLNWISASTTQTSFLADPDGDGLPNLGEYALDKNPILSDAPLFEFNLLSERTDYVSTRPMRSPDLIEWLPAAQHPTLQFFRLEFHLQQ